MKAASHVQCGAVVYMQKYKMIIAYDGTDYFGWQQQKKLPTIARTLEKKFLSVFGKKISIMGVSRTDAGVHALGQVAQFCTDLQIAPEKMQQAWSNVLPPEIVIKKIESVKDNFHLHANVQEKTYHYNFFLDRPLPNVQRFGWYYQYPVDIEKLKNALQVFVGTHDFRSFCTGDEREDTVRTITDVSVQFIETFGCYQITVRGQKFLRYMVRRIVGACLEVASRDFLSVHCLQEALAQKNPQQTLPKAPAKGLVLHKVVYKT